MGIRVKGTIFHFRETVFSRLRIGYPFSATTSSFMYQDSFHPPLLRKKASICLVCDQFLSSCSLGSTNAPQILSPIGDS